jgi:hypothetical protein
MNTQAKAAQFARPTTMTTIEKLQKALIRIEQSHKIALQYMNAKDPLTSGRALVALGLLQQAKAQVNAACQNMGFSIDSLLVIDERANNPRAEQQRLQLKQAKVAVVKLLVQKANLSREAVFISMQAFAEESAIMADLMVSRANDHLKTCVKRVA